MLDANLEAKIRTTLEWFFSVHSNIRIDPHLFNDLVFKLTSAISVVVNTVVRTELRAVFVDTVGVMMNTLLAIVTVLCFTLVTLRNRLGLFFAASFGFLCGATFVAIIVVTVMSRHSAVACPLICGALCHQDCSSCPPPPVPTPRRSYFHKPMWPGTTAVADWCVHAGTHVLCGDDAMTLFCRYHKFEKAVSAKSFQTSPTAYSHGMMCNAPACTGVEEVWCEG